MHTSVDIDDHGNGLLTGETVGEMWVGIPGWLCGIFTSFGGREEREWGLDT